MGLFIGMDEAGYGPNLGPLVVTVTAWEVPGVPRDVDLWNAFQDIVAQTCPSNASQLQIADSKQVYSPAKGMRQLEQSVHCALRMLQSAPAGFHELCEILGSRLIPPENSEPWFDAADLPVPQLAKCEDLAEIGRRWAECGERQGIRLRAIQSDVVLTARFNRLCREYGSKGVALSRISMQLLRRVWDPDATEPTLIIGDKHGGRNRYDGLLDEILDGQMIFRLQEGRELSRYRIGTTEVDFQTKAEAHLPVALASLVSKYVRELAMDLFNTFWKAEVTDLKPTKGYPVDARRFKDDIAEAQSRLQMTDDVLWRAR